ncbi:hypothetical protein CW304_01380 [Bacillus sp. UFRGS-B20]|nr:hypothetical protein CW304_01380 [Bacillus sp. UFRGS-B20]
MYLATCSLLLTHFFTWKLHNLHKAIPSSAVICSDSAVINVVLTLFLLKLHFNELHKVNN